MATVDILLLKSILDYNSVTGDFTYKIKRGNKPVGSVAGTMNDTYIQISINGIKYLAHRLAWLYYYNAEPIDDIDHIDNNKHNNAINNLREATRTQNNHNRVYGNNTNKYRGVCKTSSGKYRASIKINKKDFYIGCYNTPEQASLAYETKAKEIHGKFYKNPDYAYSDTIAVPIKQNSKTGFTGVRFSGSKFKAVIKLNGKNVHLGTFDTAEEAHAVFLSKKDSINDIK